MKLQIKKYQPSKYENGLIFNKKTQQITCHHNRILIGRNIKQYDENCDTVSVNHNSISRKHVEIVVPPCLRQGNIRRIGKSMVHKGDQVVPKFYFGWGGFWEDVPEDLRVKIRQYCGQERCIVIKDMNSKFGMFRQFSKLTLYPQKPPKNSINKSPKINQITQPIQNNKTITVQFGNQTIIIKEIIQKLNKFQYIQYRESLSKQINNLKWIEVFIDEGTDIEQYYCILLKQYKEIPGNSKQNQISNDYAVVVNKNKGICSKKVTIGRHSFCNLQINRSSISRKQASLYVNQSGNWMIQDENSTNKSWLKCDKIKFPIKDLIEKKINSPKLSLTDEEMSLSYIEASTQVYQPMVIKLGQVRIDIQIIDNGQNSQELRNMLTVGVRDEKEDYERILVDL